MNATRWALLLTCSVVACDSGGSAEGGATASSSGGGQTGPLASTSTGGPVGPASGTGTEAVTSSTGADGTGARATVGSEGGTVGVDACEDVSCNYESSCGGVPSDMVCVPAGVFGMGWELWPTVDGVFDGPPRLTCMPTFFIDRTEVTAGAYRSCVESGGCSPSSGGADCSVVSGVSNELPADCVTWSQASEYCEWVGKRLPTEAEWEKAARGADLRRYPWGSEPPSCERVVMHDGNAGGCSRNSALPVGSMSPAGDSPYGVQNMGGNVAEWTADIDGFFDPCATDDPTGASGKGNDADRRVIRGGAWSTGNPTAFSAVFRNPGDPLAFGASVGFRCATRP